MPGTAQKYIPSASTENASFAHQNNPPYPLTTLYTHLLVKKMLQMPVLGVSAYTDSHESLFYFLYLGEWQRAVQTQLYYFQEFRDGFKKQWLEDFLEHGS